MSVFSLIFLPFVVTDYRTKMAFLGVAGRGCIFLLLYSFHKCLGLHACFSNADAMRRWHDSSCTSVRLDSSSVLIENWLYLPDCTRQDINAKERVSASALCLHFPAITTHTSTPQTPLIVRWLISPSRGQGCEKAKTTRPLPDEDLTKEPKTKNSKLK